jgi:hypothetical protein
LVGVLTVDATGNSEDFLTFYPPKEVDPDAQDSDAAPSLADEIHQVLAALPDLTAKSGRDLRAAMRDAGLKFSTDSALAAFDDLVFQGRVKEIPGKNKAVGYRAVVADSGVPQESPVHGVPSGVPFGVPLIESGTPEHPPVSVPRNTPEHSGTLEGESEPGCRDCGSDLLSPQSQNNGRCERCRLDALAAEETKSAPVKGAVLPAPPKQLEGGKATITFHSSVFGTRQEQVRQFKVSAPRPYAQYATSVSVSFVRPRKRNWLYTDITPTDVLYITIAVDGQEVYDSRRDVPCDMERWNADAAKFGKYGDTPQEKPPTGHTGPLIAIPARPNDRTTT